MNFGAYMRTVVREGRRRASLFSKRRIIACALVGVLASVILIPLPRSFLSDPMGQSLRITDRNGALLYEKRSDRGTSMFMAYTDIPAQIVSVLIAAEDRTFFSHSGISVRGILRAMRENMNAGRTVAGGSTITQQLVRSRLMPRKRSYPYKLLEIALALKLDWQLSKEEILERYLNTVYFGHQAYGIASASKTYFGKNPSELSYAETVFLIGLLKSPVGYDPFHSMPAALKRQRALLTSFYDSGIITKEKLMESERETIRLTEDRVSIRAPHFSLMVSQNAERGQREIRTTLDAHLQSEVELIVQNALDALKDKNVTSAAVVVLDTRSGDVLTLVGSGDYFNESIDGAVNSALSPRQPGSAIKPFTYALALERGDTAATAVADVESQFFTQDGNPYTPRNYDFEYHGLVRYREALANSYNIAAVKVLQRVGIDRLLALLTSIGITTLTEDAEHYGLALTLGDAEVSLLELTQAYGIFARSGRTLHVRLRTDQPIETGTQAVSAGTAWLIADILSDDDARLPEFGENGPLSFEYPVAAKTGTTRNSRDNWTIGFTTERIVGVWVGNADNSPMRGTSGVTGAGPIFHNVMDAAMKYLPKMALQRPKNIVSAEICRLSGKLPTQECAERMMEHFVAGTVPTERDAMHKKILIDTRNTLLASDSCDRRFVREIVYIEFPPELKKWAIQNGYPQAPANTSPLCGTKNEAIERQSEWVLIQNPHVRDHFLLDPLIPNESEHIIFEAVAAPLVRSVEWRVDGRSVGEGIGLTFRYAWKPTIGTHTIEAITGNARDERTIVVSE